MLVLENYISNFLANISKYSEVITIFFTVWLLKFSTQNKKNLLKHKLKL